MKMKKRTIFLSVLFLAALYPAAAQSSKSVCSSCNFLVTIAPPQLLVNKALTQSEVNLVFQLAVRDGHILDDGVVKNRKELAKLAFLLLGRKDLDLRFGSVRSKRATLVAYILEMENGDSLHYALTGTNKSIVFNPCDISGSAQTFLEVYVFAR